MPPNENQGLSVSHHGSVRDPEKIRHDTRMAIRYRRSVRVYDVEIHSIPPRAAINRMFVCDT